MKTFQNAIKAFLGGKMYVLTVMLLIFSANTLTLDVPCAILLAVLAVLGFLFCDDLRFLIPPLCGFIAIIPISHTPYLPTESDFYTTGAIPVIIAIGSVFLAASIVIFVLRKKEKLRLPRSFIFGGLCAFALALMLNGLFYPQNGWKNFGYGIGMAAVFVAIYLLFALFHPRTKENAEHFLFTLAALGITVTAELLVLYFTHVSFDGFIPIKNTIMIGWGTWTQIGALLTVTLPCALYFALKPKRWLFSMLSGGAIFLGIILTISRGAWLYGGTILLIALIYLCFKGENKKKTRILCFVLLGLVLLCSLLLLDKLLTALSAFMQVGFSDNGRFEIWKSAIAAFKAAPLFGVGFFNSGIVLGGFPPIMPYLYHNTLLQMLGSCGIYGFIFYLLHRVGTVRLAIQKRRSPICLFLLLSAAALVLVSLTDEHLFHVYPAFWYVIALHLAEGDYES